MQTISSSHWMLREIQEQPLTLATTWKHYVGRDASFLQTAVDVEKWIASHERFLVLVSGSSRHASLFSAQLLRSISTLRISVERGIDVDRLRNLVKAVVAE